MQLLQKAANQALTVLQKLTLEIAMCNGLCCQDHGYKGRSESRGRHLRKTGSVAKGCKCFEPARNERSNKLQVIRQECLCCIHPQECSYFKLIRGDPA